MLENVMLVRMRKSAPLMLPTLSWVSSCWKYTMPKIRAIACKMFRNIETYEGNKKKRRDPNSPKSE